MNKQILLFPLFLSGLILSCRTIPPAGSGSANFPLENTYWKLVELNGQPVAAASPGGREMHIRLLGDSSRLTGWAGCNMIGGSYTLQAEVSRIKFSRVFSTMMACDNLEIEKRFVDMIERVDNYNLVDNRLILNRARMAPLARFEAVEGK